MEDRKRYTTDNAYYKTQDGVWVFAEVLYDTELDMHINPDGSLCTRVRESVPYGEIVMNGNRLAKDGDDLEAMKLPKDVLDCMNNEYEFYQVHLEQYLKT